ncbi:hypothetical protein ACMGGR_12940 [Erwinia sp. BNK-24-b]
MKMKHNFAHKVRKCCLWLMRAHCLAASHKAENPLKAGFLLCSL